ncbi:MAG: hypothetical protein QOH42_1471, partial [Blastocatellia bacterium]|nr:hypothetical protein [Blastocatellia bacterium]
VLLGGAGKDPANVRPPAAIMRRVWIVTALVAVRVVYAMRGDPVNGSTFERKGGANSQEILDGLRYLVTAVGEQPVISHADAQALSHPGQDRADNQKLPTPIKKRRNGAEVKNDHPNRSRPAKSLMPGLSFFIHLRSFFLLPQLL